MISPLTLLIFLVTVFTVVSAVPAVPSVRIKANNYIKIQCRGQSKPSRLYTAEQQKLAVRGVIRHVNFDDKSKPKSWEGRL
ncbi:hypothetical protein MBLNU13_g09678t1 [Cladosporium sp. NU13]